MSSDGSFCSFRKHSWRMQFKGMVGIGQAKVGEEERDSSGEMLGGEGRE